MEQIQLPLVYYETLNVKGLPRFISKIDYDTLNQKEYEQLGSFRTLSCSIHNNINSTNYSVEEYLKKREFRA